MKKAVVILADGFEEIEALSVVDVLRRGGVVCDMCSIAGRNVTGSHGIKVTSDTVFKDTDFQGYDVLVLPGGMPGASNLRDNDDVIEAVKMFESSGKIIGAICAAPIVLYKAGIINGKDVTSHPSVQNQIKECRYVEEIVAEDGNIITSRGPATAIYFALAILKRLGLGDKAAELKKGMMLNFVEQKDVMK